MHYHGRRKSNPTGQPLTTEQRIILPTFYSNHSSPNDSSGYDSRRADLTAGYLRLRKNRRFWFGTGSLQTNDELGIAERFLPGSGIGRFLWQ